MSDSIDVIPPMTLVTFNFDGLDSSNVEYFFELFGLKTEKDAILFLGAITNVPFHGAVVGPNNKIVYGVDVAYFRVIDEEDT